MVSKKKNPLLVCEGRKEKSVPRDHLLSSLGKPRDAKWRSSGQIFLPYPHTHDKFLLDVHTNNEGYSNFCKIVS